MDRATARTVADPNGHADVLVARAHHRRRHSFRGGSERARAVLAGPGRTWKGQDRHRPQQRLLSQRLRRGGARRRAAGGRWRANANEHSATGPSHRAEPAVCYLRCARFANTHPSTHWSKYATPCTRVAPTTLTSCCAIVFFFFRHFRQQHIPPTIPKKHPRREEDQQREKERKKLDEVSISDRRRILVLF